MGCSQRSVGSLPGVGPKRLTALEAAGVFTVADLLKRVPKRYSDRRSSLPLDPVALKTVVASGNSEVTVEGRLQRVRRIFTRRPGFNLVQGEVIDGDGRTLRCIWFNRPYLAKSVDESKLVLLTGQLRQGRSSIELMNADISDPAAARGIQPQYGSLGGLGDKALRRLMAAALDALGEEPRLIDDPVPPELLSKRGLHPLGQALRELHRPADDTDILDLVNATTTAHQRLIYGELFAMQLEMAKASLAIRGRRKPHRYVIDDRLRATTKAVLPFRLTGAQRRCLGEIVADMNSATPMLRLLQGDVGCGKTIVAAMAALVAVESDLQVAFLSPTEMLAEQLAESLEGLFEGRHEVGLLTSSVEDRLTVSDRLSKGELKLVSGTHALIQDAVGFDRLGLVVIDEQHRFGVKQRLGMAAKGTVPDLLLMTATPIPRSLALAVFGDLSLSTIDELPPGRGIVQTELLEDSQRAEAIRIVQQAVVAGGRAFVVFPRIDNDDAGAASLSEQGVLYRKALGTSVGELTGRTEASERKRLLDDFRGGEISVLLATTVIEVGIDVPEATVIVIEGADRFGLSQLHQLRGRVGRSSRGGRCLAVHSSSCSPETLHRLSDFASTADGFALAELDLKTRGPGNLMGLEQSGFSQWTPARLASAVQWLEAAREDAFAFVEALETTSSTRQRDLGVAKILGMAGG